MQQHIYSFLVGTFLSSMTVICAEQPQRLPISGITRIIVYRATEKVFLINEKNSTSWAELNYDEAKKKYKSKLHYVGFSGKEPPQPEESDGSSNSSPCELDPVPKGFTKPICARAFARRHLFVATGNAIYIFARKNPEMSSAQ